MAEHARFRRLFSAWQRRLLYADAEGCCRACGADVGNLFHADHIRPFSQGGPTELENGQILCPVCNLRKGARSGVAHRTDIPSQTEMPSAQVEIPLNQTEHLSLQTNHSFLPVPSRPVPAAQALPVATAQALPVDVATTAARSYRRLPLRAWQCEAMETWRARRAQGLRDMTVVACTGSGKTRLALALSLHELTQGGCALIVIVVPSRVLKRQWVKAAQGMGLVFTEQGMAGLAAEVDGLVITYSQLSRQPELMRLLCLRRPVFGILDEIHRGGEGLAWGEGIRKGLGDAEARLCLSATPVRSDQLALPFVQNDAQGRVLSDVHYPAAVALAEGVVRPVFFMVFGGFVRWRDGQGEHSVSFDDRLGEVAGARRLRAALDPGGGWLEEVVGHAAASLAETRRFDRTAKGLVVCIDAAHARAVAALVARIAGEMPAVALSDDAGAAEVLERFGRDDTAWLIVCRLGGEGFDVPTLRVLVYATVVHSAVHFVQVVGRVMRKLPGRGYQDGLVYLPADPRLTRLAEGFLDASGPTGAPGDEGEEWDAEDRWGGGPGNAETRFLPLSSEAAPPAIITAGAVLSEAHLREARDARENFSVLDYLPVHYIAAMLADVEMGAVDYEDTELSVRARPGSDPLPVQAARTGGFEDSEQMETYDEKVVRLRRACTRLTKQIAAALDAPVKDVYRFYRDYLGFGQTAASLAQLERKHVLLLQKLQELGGPTESAAP